MFVTLVEITLTRRGGLRSRPAIRLLCGLLQNKIFIPNLIYRKVVQNWNTNILYFIDLKKQNMLREMADMNFKA